MTHRIVQAAIALAAFLALATSTAEAGPRKKRPREAATRGERGGGAYNLLLGVDMSFVSSSRVYEAQGQKSKPSDSSDLSIGFNCLFAAGPVFAGPLLGYSSASSGEGESRSESSSLDIGGMVDLPFAAELGKDKAVPHAYGGLRYNTELQGSGNDGASGYRIGVGVGLYYFLGRNIALDPKIELQKQTLESGGELAFTVDTTIIGLLLGLSAFM